MKTNNEIPTCKGLKDLEVWKKDIGIDEIRKVIRSLKRNLTSKLLKDKE